MLEEEIKRRQKIDDLLSRFKNLARARDMYLHSNVFRTCIKTLEHGGDAITLLDELVVIIEDQQNEIHRLSLLIPPQPFELGQPFI